MKTRRRVGVKIVAAGLIVGGLLGILGTTIALRNHKMEWPAPAVALAVFSWTTLSGVATWQGRAWGFRSARLLLSLQILQFSIGGLSYEFSSLLSFRLMAGNTTRQIGGNIGSSFDLNWAAQDAGFMFGFNLVAACALTYLLLAARSSSYPAR
jgi:hypothetical protein